DLPPPARFMRELVDKLRSSWLELVCISLLVRPGHHPNDPGRRPPQQSFRRFRDGAHRGSAALARCCKPTWRPERMKMRRTLGVSLAIFAISAAMPAKQAHSGDRPSEQGAKAAKPAKAEAPASTRAAGQQLAASQLAAARIEQPAAP